MFSRRDLELVIQKKKLDEVYNWFHEHFVSCSQITYLTRRPLVIFQGTTGSGKSTVLRWVAQELGLDLKEFTETTDLTSINYELYDRNQTEEVSIDRRKAQKFEQYVINNILYKSLISCQYNTFNNNQDVNDITGQITKHDGVIIHVETPLSFAKNQKLTVHALCRLLKIVRELSKRTPRRVAIVFENVEGDSNETSMLSAKMKLSLGFTIFKFNPIIKTNMKHVIDNYISQLKNPVVLDKDTREQLIRDANGDMTACVKTLQLICNNPLNRIDDISSNSLMVMNSDHKIYNQFYNASCPPNKKTKFTNGGNLLRDRKLVLNASLMRDTTQSTNYFHLLGKIFYQKRYYPELKMLRSDQYTYLRSHSQLDRPFELENDTETLLNMMDIQPRNLLTWLHQHYTRFCSSRNIFKATMFLENLTDVDILSLNSSQSSQFTEFCNIVDQLQAYVSIDATVFSLYENKLMETKPSHKKVTRNGQSWFLKSSVESVQSNYQFGENVDNSIYSFTKPISTDIYLMAQNYNKLVGLIQDKTDGKLSSSNLIVDYLPYLKILDHNKRRLPKTKYETYYNHKNNVENLPLGHDDHLLESFDLLDTYGDMGIEPEMVEKRTEALQILIEKFETLQSTQDSN